MGKIIGIDLGTTQCALSYVDLEDKNLKVRNLEITQLVSGGMIEGSRLANMVLPPPGGPIINK